MRPLHTSPLALGRSLPALLALAGAAAQAQVTLTCAVPFVASFQTCLFSVKHEDGDAHAWEWRVAPGSPGAFTRMRSGACNLYRAPLVTEAQTALIQVRLQGVPDAPWTSFELPLRPAKVRIAWVLRATKGTAAEVQFGLATVASGRTCTVQAFQEGAMPRAWTWSVQEPQGGGFTRLRSGPRNVYRAPVVLEPTTFHLTVEAAESGEGAILPVTVLPVDVPGETEGCK